MKKHYDVDATKTVVYKKKSVLKKPRSASAERFLMKNIKEFNETEQLAPPLGRRRAPRTAFEDIFND